MVSLNCVNNLLVFFMLASNLNTKLNMCTLFFVVKRFTDIVVWGEEAIKPIKKLELTQGMASVNGVQFLIISLEQQESPKIKKADIEKTFGIKVV